MVASPLEAEIIVLAIVLLLSKILIAMMETGAKINNVYVLKMILNVKLKRK